MPKAEDLLENQWANRFFFSLFKTGQIPSYYSLPIKNKLTDDVLLGGNSNDLLDSGKQANLKTIAGNTIIWDIPEYLDVPLKELDPKIKVEKIRQYKGYLIQLSPHKNIDEFLGSQLSARSRKKLRSKTRKLEAEYNVRYAFYYGEIERPLYDRLFDALYGFLEDRFEEKKTHNNNLHKWEVYRKLLYPMIADKRGSLFVIYADEKPITIGMQFHLSKTVFSYIQSYDLAYSDYNMGDISTTKRLEWCFDQGFDTFDVSMGETVFKHKWCNQHYDLYFHMFYNSKSIPSVLKYKVQRSKLELKQYLRDKDILGKFIQLDKLKFRLKALRG